MKSKDIDKDCFEHLWLICPNCGSDKIEQKRQGNERALVCRMCGYYMKEGFATFLLAKKDDMANTEYDKYLPRA